MQKQDQDYILSLFPAIEKIKDDGIRQKVILTWYNAWKRGNFSRIEDGHQFEPARERIAYTNVDHTNQVCRACERMGEMVAEVLNLQVTMDYLLAGALLHDVDKMVIFDARTGGFTEHRSSVRPCRNGSRHGPDGGASRDGRPHDRRPLNEILAHHAP
jgi:hypothetical protein